VWCWSINLCGRVQHPHGRTFEQLLQTLPRAFRRRPMPLGAEHAHQVKTSRIAQALFDHHTPIHGSLSRMQ
jgi:hypothetical protein